jgi:ATP-dependent DNA helicase RecG
MTVPGPSTSAPAPGDAPVRSLPGVGKGYAEALLRLEIQSVDDLLHHVPVRWVDRRGIRPLGSLGDADVRFEEGPDGRLRRAIVTVLGTVTSAKVKGGRKDAKGRWRPIRRGAPPPRLEVVLRDETGWVQLVFFGGGWREEHFQPGSRILVSGPLSSYHGRFQFQSPEYEVLGRDEEAELHTGRLFPVYPSTRGVTQRHLRTWVRYALDRVLPRMEDPLPESLRRRYRLLPLDRALASYHFPPDPEARDEARRRLAFEELFLDQLFVYAVRLRRERGRRAAAIPAGGSRFRRIRAALPFRLTSDQERALGEILADMASGRPMNRFLQGDVGSGKTVVALLAAAAAADAGIQAAFMAPTEILAEQHLRTLRELGAPFDLEPRLLTGSTGSAARREVLQSLADGTGLLAVGTHALFQEEVRFRNLGLVVMDEQHRFGVMQRVAMTGKGIAPHVLVMSATPIPRSLALVRFADLELSVIRHRPAGRGRVITRVTGEHNRPAVYEFLAERLREGRQAYIIYPLVEESEKSDLKAATTMARRLARRPEFKGFGVALLHGQMKSEEKEAAMSRFTRGEVRVLVATTVVEVGIDVPNASFLIIEHPERYGLSQLHQLRGRIGRGRHTSYCVLIRDDKLDDEAAKRLEIFAGTDDGFALAEMDLTLRGQGDVAGTRQSGRPGYRIADPWRDVKMTEVARDEARKALDGGAFDGDMGPGWEPLRRRLRRLLETAGPLVDAG